MTRRTGPAARLWFAVLGFILCGAAGAAAQVRPDTVPPDTLVLPIPPEQMERDTVPTLEGDALRTDSITPAPTLPPYPEPLPSGFSVGRWEWDREELLRYHGLSLLELLERVPGVAVTRAGGFGRPAGLAAFGLGGGRVRVFLDGYELDPLTAAVPDLQQIGIVDLDVVRVERDLHGLRIDLETFRLQDSRPFSQLEIGAGNYEAKMLRAYLARPVGSRNILSGGFDLVTTSGFGVEEPYRVTNGRLRWSHLLRPNVGLLAEFRQSSAQRESEDFPEEGDRRDVLLRGRARLLERLTVDGLVGRSWREAGPADSLPLELGVNHAMARAGYMLSRGWVEAAARLRFGDENAYAAPSSDLALRGAFRPISWVLAEGEVRRTRTGEVDGTELSALVRTGPFLGLSAFAQLSTGARGLGLLRDSLVEVPDPDDPLAEPATERFYLFPVVESDAGGVRAGAEWQGRYLSAGAAVLRLEPTVIVPFGLPFDRRVSAAAADEATGLEGYFQLPLPLLGGTVLLDGWYTRFQELQGRPYLPAEQGRLALEYHALLYDGQFEPTLRLEGVHRGSMLVPGEAGTAFETTTTAYDLLNFFMQIRILDVRAFLTVENLLNNVTAADLPGRPLPGPRTIYGVRWHFYN